MPITKKRLETLGGIGSILTGFVCVWIGVVDFQNQVSWKIWAIMTVVLIANGIAMLRHAAKRSEDDGTPLSQVVRART